MNKKGILFSLLIKIIFIGLLITVVSSTLLNKDWYYDTADFIKNLFEPPEVDPLPSATRMMVEREEGYEYLLKWKDFLESIKESDQDYCYAKIDSTTENFREAELSVEFFTDKADSFQIMLKQQGAAVSKRITINAPFCIIAEPREGSYNILSNFREAFYEGDDDKMDACVDDPSSCSLIFSKPESLLSESSVPESIINEIKSASFRAAFILNAQDQKASRNSFSTFYQLSGDFSKSIDEDEDGVINGLGDSSGKRQLTNMGILILKLGENICLLPMAYASAGCEPWLLSNSRSLADINVLRRSCFYDQSENVQGVLNNVPRCPIKTMSDEKAKEILIQALLNPIDYENKKIVALPKQAFLETIKHIIVLSENSKPVEYNFLISFRSADQEETSNLTFKWSERESYKNSWYIITGDEELKIEEELLDESSENNILPLYEELKKIVSELNNKNLEQGITFLINYEESSPIIKINNKDLKTILDNMIYD